MAGLAPAPAAQVAALAVLLNHPVLSADPLLLCSAAQVCSSWRTAVAAAGAGTTAVVLDNQTNPQRTAAELADTLLQKVGSFSMWLSKHAPAVQSITVACATGAAEISAAYTTACQILTLSLQLAATRPMRLRLQRFASSIASSELMAALPASLTELNLSSDAFLPYLDKKCCLKGLLQPFQHIRALTIDMEGDAGDIGVEALGDLSRLTRLDLNLEYIRSDVFGALCETLHGMRDLQDLQLALEIADGFGDCDVAQQLRSMTALTRLDLKLHPFPVGAGAWLAMPTNLLSLSATFFLDDSVPVEGQEADFNPVLAMQLLELKNLRQLTLNFGFQSLAKFPGSLTVLQQLTGLESLGLEYASIRDASADAPEWSKLRSMRSISIIDGLYIPHDDAALQAHKAIMRCLPALVDLTRLELSVIDKSAGARSHVCHWLPGLTKLQHLRLSFSGSTHDRDRDCSRLIPLRRLTRLVVTSAGNAVDDTVAVALACSMPQLRDLNLRGASLKSDAFVPAVAQLQHLTRLTLIGTDAGKKAWAKQLHEFRRAAGLPKILVLV